MLRIGHRGAAGYEPENTLRSFAKALALGVDMIELDVHCCKSGEIVVIHDLMLDRTTNGHGVVQTTSLDALQNLDAGKGEHIPTLLEVRDLVNRRAQINIEIKSTDATKGVVECIQESVRSAHWKYEDFLVSSFDFNILGSIKKIDPRIRIGALIIVLPEDRAAFAQEMRAYSVHSPVNSTTKAFVDDAHARGLQAIVWDANAPQMIQYAKDIGVDGIISDYPDRI